MSMSVCAHRRDPAQEVAGLFTGCLPCRCAKEYREELDQAAAVAADQSDTQEES